MKKVRAFCIGLATLLFTGAASVFTANIIDQDAVVKAAVYDAVQALGTERCRVALAEAFPQYGMDADWQQTFKNNVKIVSVEWIPDMTLASGMTNCDMSHTTMVLSSARMAWNTNKNQRAETVIHEFVHLVNCEDQDRLWESQQLLGASAMLGDEEAIKYFVDQETQAYKVGALCVGNEPRMTAVDPKLEAEQGEKIEELK